MAEFIENQHRQQLQSLSFDPWRSRTGQVYSLLTGASGSLLQQNERWWTYALKRTSTQDSEEVQKELPWGSLPQILQSATQRSLKAGFSLSGVPASCFWGYLGDSYSQWGWAVPGLMECRTGKRKWRHNQSHLNCQKLCLTVVEAPENSS